jgi:hypothetical protein
MELALPKKNFATKSVDQFWQKPKVTIFLWD